MFPQSCMDHPCVKSVSVLFILICYTELLYLSAVPGKMDTSMFLLSFHSVESQPNNLAHRTWLKQHRSSGSLHPFFYPPMCQDCVCAFLHMTSSSSLQSRSKWDFQKCKYLNPTSRSYNLTQFDNFEFLGSGIGNCVFFSFFFFYFEEGAAMLYC